MIKLGGILTKRFFSKKLNIKHLAILAGVALAAVILVPVGFVHSTDISNYSVSLKHKVVEYTGEEISPKVSVSKGPVKLEEGEDYTVVCKDNKDVGTATVTIKGEGAFSGKSLASFEIAKADQKIEGEKTFNENIAEDFNLEQAALTDLSFESSDEDILTVDEDGDIDAKLPGKVTVTVKAEETDSYKAADKKVTVEITETDTQEAIRKTLDWARMIADDNSYIYGHDQCPKCHSAHKVYDCIAFMVASYWHGGEAPFMERWCKRHGGVGTVRSAMSNSSDWKSLGNISTSQLEPGDVLFYRWNSGRWKHVEIYNGNNSVVGAHSRGGSDSISVRGMSSHYRAYSAVYRYVGN